MKFEYERKYFIKDLFNAKEILGHFNHLIFESMYCFVKAKKMDLFDISGGRTIHIILKNFKEYEYFCQMIQKINCKKTDLWIEIRTQELYDQIYMKLIPKKYSVILPFELNPNVPKIWSTPHGKRWLGNNRLIRKVKLTGESFKDDVYKILCAYAQEHTRFFYLEIDYQSFDNCQIRDLPLLKHWCYKLKEYTVKEERHNIPPIVIIQSGNMVKKIFIANDLKLYLSEMKNITWCLDLIEHLDKNGEDISFKELNWWRTYIDLHRTAIYNDFKIYNWALVDYEQNLLSQGHINEIPAIIGLLSWWLH